MSYLEDITAINNRLANFDAISIGDLAYNVHHDHLSDKATAEYRQQSIEMQQQILDELEKQTKLLEHSSKE